jgi:hypothetical protein
VYHWLTPIERFAAAANAVLVERKGNKTRKFEMYQTLGGADFATMPRRNESKDPKL